MHPMARVAAVAIGLVALVGAFTLRGLTDSGGGNSAASPLPAEFSGECTSGRSAPSSNVNNLGGYSALVSNAASSGSVALSRLQADECAIRVQVSPKGTSDSPTERMEMSGPSTRWYRGQSVWYALSFEIARGSPFPRRGGWMLVHQFFAQDLSRGVSGGSPPVAVEINSTGGILIDVRGGSKVNETANAPRHSSYLLGRAHPGTWNGLLLNIRWSTGASGLVRVWLKGTNARFSRAPQISAKGPDVLTVAGDVLPVYAETGIYRSRAAATQVVLFGGLWARRSRSQAYAFFRAHPG
jgi:hypothetical protein